MPTRLDLLHQFLEEDPHDPFNIYALALEYQKSNPAMAKEFYDKLLTEHKTYLPTYYHAANLYLDLDLKEEAATILREGMILARQQNELKTMRELQTVYDEVM
jgi:hypothetical protein